jgi:hypothetical protein
MICGTMCALLVFAECDEDSGTLFEQLYKRCVEEPPSAHMQRGGPLMTSTRIKPANAEG